MATESLTEQVIHSIEAGTIAAGATLVTGGNLFDNCDRVLEKIHGN